MLILCFNICSASSVSASLAACIDFWFSMALSTTPCTRSTAFSILPAMPDTPRAHICRPWNCIRLSTVDFIVLLSQASEGWMPASRRISTTRRLFLVDTLSANLPPAPKEPSSKKFDMSPPGLLLPTMRGQMSQSISTAPSCFPASCRSLSSSASMNSISRLSSGSPSPPTSLFLSARVAGAPSPRDTPAIGPRQPSDTSGTNTVDDSNPCANPSFQSLPSSKHFSSKKTVSLCPAGVTEFDKAAYICLANLRSDATRYEINT
mmetsp:Transcript_22993/g.53715  ORF Transcript_22993/g.53715 Transcript_22993/m.53715 type:complete len:263 (+) Transcript_22993:1146-1934(+)